MNEPTEVVDRERRQLELMMERIERFRRGELGIGQTVGDLEGLLGELQLMNEAWRDQFVSAWYDLEVPYAIALDGLGPLPDASDLTVREGLNALEEQVKDGLATL